MSPLQNLEAKQALAKQFAEILHFTLKFDDLKVRVICNYLNNYQANYFVVGVQVSVPELKYFIKHFQQEIRICVSLVYNSFDKLVFVSISSYTEQRCLPCLIRSTSIFVERLSLPSFREKLDIIAWY